MKFRVEPRLLDHFGIAMYNTVPKAIAELCANAYDADATRVKVTYSDDEIKIVDNGVGMTKADLENNYLRLGRDRREDDSREITPLGRPVIGNKGIGKLAGFGIAQTMVVRTRKGKAETTIELDREALEDADDLEAFEIKPKRKRLKRAAHMTEVRLSRLLEEVTVPDENELRAYLSRHLPARSDWAILVNGVECSPQDIPGKKHAFSDVIEGFGKVEGFYVVAKDRRGLKPGFAIRVRDRVVQEPSLFKLNQQTHGFFNLARIVGELRTDFLDPIEGGGSRRDKFVINTSRSGFNPEDPAVQALEDYARTKLTLIANGLAKQRTKERKKAALKRNPDIEQRLKDLGPDVYEKLDQTLESLIAKLSKNETNETVDEIVDLIIRYYESDALRIILESVRKAEPKDVERLSRLLAEYGTARVGEVTQTLHTQLEVIDLLYQKVKEGVLEAEIHKIVAENIWLLRDGLTYWHDNKSFATTLRDKLAEKFKYASGKRPDLVCFDDRTLQAKPGDSAKRLVVVEFKRPGVKISSAELQQVMTYKSIFAASLANFGGDAIDVVILGDEFDEAFDRDALRPNYQILSYEELLADAGDRYRELYRSLVPEGVPRDASKASTKKPGRTKKSTRSKAAKGRKRSRKKGP